MTNEEWLNNTSEGGYHKNLMIMENNFGVPDTKVKQELFLQTAFLGLRCKDNKINKTKSIKWWKFWN